MDVRKERKPSAPRRFWLIEGEESGAVIFRAIYPLSRYSDRQIVELLQLLSARHGLSYREICGAKGRGRTALLDVHRSFCPVAFLAGPNMVFTARSLQAGNPLLDRPEIAN